MGLWPRASHKEKPAQTPLAGLRFVFTGKLQSMTRQEARELVHKAGGEVGDSISKNVDYLVAGADPGNKLNRAQKLGLEVLSEEGFAGLLADARQ